jgi:RimJ/RimL family protein N-acetyltransferase
MFPDLLCDDVFRLETQRLWLRWPRAADAPAIQRLAGEAAVAEMTARIPHPYPDGAAEAFILAARATNMEGDALTLALTKKRGSGEAVGCIGLERDAQGRLTLGYWLGKPYWGKGLMSEAAKGLTQLVFQVTDEPGLFAAARGDNPGSRRVLEKLSFVQVGSVLIDAPARGGAAPCGFFGLTREAWLDGGARSGLATARAEELRAC